LIFRLSEAINKWIAVRGFYYSIVDKCCHGRSGVVLRDVIETQTVR
jgi:hypothetical protein